MFLRGGDFVIIHKCADLFFQYHKWQLIEHTERNLNNFLCTISLDPAASLVFSYELFLSAVHTSSLKDLGLLTQLVEVWFCVQWTISALTYPNVSDHCPVKLPSDRRHQSFTKTGFSESPWCPALLTRSTGCLEEKLAYSVTDSLFILCSGHEVIFYV